MVKLSVLAVVSKDKNATRDFYRTPSELYKFNNGRIPICKDCMLDEYNKLLTIYEGSINKSFRHFLLRFDAYYDEQLYSDCSTKSNFIGEYFRLLSTKDKKTKTSLNNKIDSVGANESDISLSDGIISQSLILEWGRGRLAQDYMVLENRYKELIKQFPSETSEEKYIIKDICKLELDIEECRKNGKLDKIATLENVKSKKMHDLDAIPSERKLSAKDDDIKIFGCGVKVYETSKPVPTLSPKFKDVDYLTSYWERSITKPMAKINGLASGEYSLEKGMEDIEFTPEYLEALGEVNE